LDRASTASLSGGLSGQASLCLSGSRRGGCSPSDDRRVVEDAQLLVHGGADAPRVSLGARASRPLRLRPAAVPILLAHSQACTLPIASMPECGLQAAFPARRPCPAAA